VLGEQDAASEKANLFLIRLGISAFLAMNVMALSWAIYDREWITLGMDEEALPYLYALLFVLSLPVMIVAGYPFVRNAIGEIRTLRLSMDSLIALGTIAAFGFSTHQAFTGGTNIYFDTATMTLVLVTTGRYLEAHAKARTSNAVRGLLSLQPSTARVVRGNHEEIMPASAVRVGDIIKMLPGERIPLDADVLEGRTSVNEAILTGEPLPRMKQPRDRLYAATVNIDGAVLAQVVSAQSDSVHAHVVRLVEQAQLVRSPIQQTVDRISALFIPLVITLAIVTFAAWMVVGGWNAALLHALTVLVVACPCALGIGTPIATALALGKSAEHGVLVRSTAALERLASAKVIAFDKTGTLTRGMPQVSRVLSNMDEGAFLSVLASLEANSEHPLGKAVVQHAKATGVHLLETRNVVVQPGQGIQGEVRINGIWKTIKAGRPALFGVVLNEDSSVLSVSWDGKVRGSVEFNDTLRSSAGETVETLHRMSLTTAMLSGDSQNVTERTAKELGIHQSYGALMPADKLQILASLKLRGTTVMVGDGINDAPSLAAADVGITLASAADIAKESADVTIIGDHLEKIPWLIAFAKKTLSTIRWNLFWAFGYNAVGIALAVAGILQPVIAAAAMVASSLFIIGNSVRLKP
jgi:heavy metal translocating P-type ATPase